MEEDLIMKKAELNLGGGILLPKGFEMPFRLSHSTAGPGAGTGSAVFAFGGFRVKKTVSYENGEFELVVKGDGLSLTHRGQPFLDEVEIRPVVFHCPEQAFFNLDQRCIYHCAYCASPLLDKSTLKGLTDESIVESVLEAMKTQKVVSVSLTSGVVDSVDATVDRFVSCIRAIRDALPDIPIGVEPYVSEKGHLVKLKDAGADEIKINLESPRKDIFEKVCPELDHDRIWTLLEDAVEIFGRGKVSSNIIIGMGESNNDVTDCFKRLASLGVIPTMRALRTTSFNKNPLMRAIGIHQPVSPKRVIALAKVQKWILEDNHLTTLTCHTMCLECTCCDLVPFRDL